MNAIDQVIAWFSPETAMKRARARVVLRNAQHLAYDGAVAGRRTDGWFRPGTSANAETAAGMVSLRNGARDLVRNNPLAAQALHQFSTKIVGTGIRPKSNTGIKRTDDILDAKFDKWARQVNYYGKQALIARSIPECGENIIRTRARRKEDGLAVPLALQVLEPDYIDHSKEGATPGGYIIQGVEFDGLDREVAVWLFGSHPGDTVNTDTFRRAARYDSRRVPLDNGNPVETVVRVYREDRHGQVRGVSWFAPVMRTLWDLQGYEEAEQVRKRIEACLACFISSPASEGTAPSLGPQSTESGGNNPGVIEEFRPGMVVRTLNGETVTIAEPKAAGGTTEYTRRLDRKTAIGLGLLYELLSGDLSQVNYSSYRGGLVGLRDFIEMLQWQVIIPKVCDPIWSKFVTAAIIAGYVPETTPTDAVNWNPPYFDLLDRAEEAKGDLLEIRAGVSTYDQIVGRRGYDPNKQTEEIQRRNKDFDAKGIVLDCDPRRVAANGKSQADPTQDQPAA